MNKVLLKKVNLASDHKMSPVNPIKRQQMLVNGLLAKVLDTSDISSVRDNPTLY